MEIDKIMPLLMMKMGMNQGKVVNGTMVGGGDDISNIMYGFVVMQLINYLVKVIPETLKIGKTYIEKMIEKKANELKTEIISEKFSSIRYEYDSEKPNDTCMALIEYMGSLNESLKLKYKNNYFVNNSDPFGLGYKDLKCRIKIVESDVDVEKEKVVMLFEIYSKDMTLMDIRNWVSKIEDDYRILKNNKLGRNRYYFNELVFDIPSDGMGGYRFEMAPKRLIFSMTKFETNKSLKNIYGPEITEICNLVDLFKFKPEWYADRGIPHTLGMLLSGPPGTGKTSTIKAIAKDTNRHIINLSLRKTTTQQQLINLFFNETIEVLMNGETKTYSIPLEQRLYVIEDIDCLTDVVLSRELIDKEKEEERIKLQLLNEQNQNQNQNQSISQQFDMLRKKELNNSRSSSGDSHKINLSFLLNLFDGVLETPNRLLIMTSNYPDKIDSALLRPGRIDLNIKFRNCSIETMLKMFKTFFNDNEKRVINEEYSELITPARLTQILSTNYNNKEKAFESLINYLEKEKERLKEEEERKIIEEKERIIREENEERERIMIEEKEEMERKLEEQIEKEFGGEFEEKFEEKKIVEKKIEEKKIEEKKNSKTPIIKLTEWIPDENLKINPNDYVGGENSLDNFFKEILVNEQVEEVVDYDKNSLLITNNFENQLV